MKILLYSDLHISRTSSILPTNFNDNLMTYRQYMILNTAKLIKQVALETNPDIIINLGDTFDQHTLTSYDTEIARQFFGELTDLNIPQYIIIGNHEMMNDKFNSVAMLDNVNNIHLINKPTSLDINNTKLAFLPYNDKIEEIELPDGDYLFSHNDIYGSTIRDNILLNNGLKQDILKSKYKLVFNGHIHKSSIFSNIINVGSCTTHSFADDTNWIPNIYVFDTETLDLKNISNDICPLFRTYEIDNIMDLNNIIIQKLDNNYKYVLHIKCPFDIKDQVKEILSKQKINNISDIVLKDKLLLNYKISIKVKEDQKTKLEENNSKLDNIYNIDDIQQSFKEFLNISELKYPKQLYLDILEKELN